MIKRRHIGIYLILAMLGGGLLFSSCNKEEVISQPQKETEKSDIIKFGINLSELWTPDEIGDAPEETKSSGQKYSESLPMECIAGDGPATEIYMYMIEEDITAVVDTVSTETKSESVVAANIGLYAFKNPVPANGKIFMNNLQLYSDGFYGLTDTEGNPTYLYWPGADTSLTFFAYSPYFNNNIEGLSLSINNNAPVFTYEVPGDVSKHTDLMDGTVTQSGDYAQTVVFSLKHILSQIEIKAGNLGEGIYDDAKIVSVSLNNIYDKGIREMGGSGWNLVTEIVGEQQVYSVGKFTQTLNQPITSSLDGNTLGSPMYLMPQALSEDATIEVVISVTSDNPAATGESNLKRESTYTLRKKLSAFTSNWAPDKKYTYIISTPEEVEVEVTDKVIQENDSDNPVKTDLIIKNTGMSTCYIKAAIYGVWVLPGSNDVPDQVVANWDPVGDGIFDWGSDNSNTEPSSAAENGWYKHTDGFYYHLNAVESGQQTATLFDSYTLTALPPVEGAVLDLSIVVQAVYINDIEYAWPEIVADKKKSEPFRTTVQNQ